MLKTGQQFSTAEECIRAIEDYADEEAQYGASDTAPSPTRGPARAARADLADAWECRERAREILQTVDSEGRGWARAILGEEGE